MHQILHLLAKEEVFMSPTEIGRKLEHMCSVRSPGSWAQPWCRRLEDLWLAERNKHGKYRITGEGRILIDQDDYVITHSTESNLRDAVQQVVTHCRGVYETEDSMRVRAAAYGMLDSLERRDVASTYKTPQLDWFGRQPVLGVDEPEQ